MSPHTTNVTAFLLNGKEPSRRALHLPGVDYSYGELRSASAAIARYLMEGGGQKGDRVLMVCDNSFFWVAAYLGTLRAGLVCVPLPGNIAPQELDYIQRTVDAQFAFLQARLAVKHQNVLQRTSVVADGEAPGALNFVRLLSGTSQMTSALPETGPDDLAALMFTSGSTGRPRGVMVSHANIIANTESIIQCLGLAANDRIMAVLPFHYCFGTSLLHSHLRVGGSLVLDSRFMYPEAILERMRSTRCTGFAGVPSHFQILLRRSSFSKKKFPHLRYVQQAGGCLAPVFLRELRQALPETQIFVMYGQTEATARLACLAPEFLDKKLGSIGKAVPGVNLHLLNEAGEKASVGEIGEIVAEGASIARGYWHAPLESIRTFRDGRLYTGDMAKVDEDGFIYIVDRASDFLKCGGRRVSCRGLEEQLLEFDGVLEAAVVGVSDEVLGEAVKAFVVPRQTGSDREIEEPLRQFCKARMSPQLVPKEIIVLGALPKNSAGKVLKHELKVFSSRAS